MLVHNLVDPFHVVFDGRRSLRAVIGCTFGHPGSVSALPDRHKVRRKALVHIEYRVDEVGRRDVDVEV